MTFLRHPNLLLTLLLATAVIAVEMVIKTNVLPAILWILLAAHLFLNFRLPGKPRVLTTFLLTVPFAIWYRYLPRGGMTGSEFAPIDLLLTIGCYTLSLGVYHLLTTRTGGSPNQAFGASITAVALAGTATRSHAFLPLVVVFMVLVVLYLRASIGLVTLHGRRSALFRLGLAAALLVAVSCGTEVVVTNTLPRINGWLARRLLESAVTSGVGFRRTAYLGSVSDSWGQVGTQDVMIRHWRVRKNSQDSPTRKSGVNPPHPRGLVEYDETLDYLRGVVFDSYDHHAVWHALHESADVPTRDSDRGRNIFRLTEMKHDQIDLLEPGGTIYPERELGETFFLPLGVQQIGAFADRAMVGPAMTVVSEHRWQPAGGYTYYEPRRGAPLLPNVDTDLKIPPELRPPLHAIAVSIMDPKASPRENAQRLAVYFQKNFRYHIGLQLTHNKDPILEFLQDIKAGHCEYFASAAVLLLRSIDVPARYVTGFVCQEESAGGFYRIARRKDAHAWVEMYDGARGWTTFDPTPASARPPTEPTTRTERAIELLGAWWSMIASVIAYGGITGAIGVLWSWLVQMILAVPMSVWGVVILTALAWIYRGTIRRWFSRRREKAASPRVKALRAKLRRAENLVASYGLVRSPGTTAGAFLRTVRTAPIPEEVRTRAETLLCEYQAARFRPE